jgi:hypothetical protein
MCKGRRVKFTCTHLSPVSVIRCADAEKTNVDCPEVPVAKPVTTSRARTAAKQQLERPKPRKRRPRCCEKEEVRSREIKKAVHYSALQLICTECMARFLDLP